LPTQPTAILATLALLVAAPWTCLAQTSGQTVLGGLPADRVDALMRDFNQALAVECVHCHIENQWKDETKPAFTTARNMLRMVRTLNDGPLKDVGEVQCWTCHRGSVKPSRLPGEALDAEMKQWPSELADAADQVKLTMSVYDVTLGVKCDHCHVADWKRIEKKPMALVSRMNAMFEEFPKFMPATARTQCYMCHKGSTKPARQPEIAARQGQAIGHDGIQ
jgi:hypothetical protein